MDSIEVFKITHGLSSLSLDTLFCTGHTQLDKRSSLEVEKGERTQIWDIISFLNGSSSGGTNWTVQQFVLRQSTLQE